MAGIYIHIPFCKQACHYCNFHFSTTLRLKNDFLEALLQEIALRKEYLNGEPVETIYFGGGTPSLLSSEEINRIYDKLLENFDITDQPEITLEANPDDLSSQKIDSLSNTPVNRLSIGVQSFHDEDLLFMNRSHNATQAENVIKAAFDHSFENITIDLIYGAPTMNNNCWSFNLEKTFELKVPHLSAYCLTVEPKTALAHFIQKGKVKDIDDDRVVEQFEMLVEKTTAQGFDHYEISNFARPGFRSQHNSSYWTGQKYIGLGPSAHSFDGDSRQWNVANNIKYIKSVLGGKIFFEKEQLTDEDRFNEYVMTSLRTEQGIDLNFVEINFGKTSKNLLLKTASPEIDNRHLLQNKNRLMLTSKGKLLADRIISDLFLVDRSL